MGSESVKTRTEAGFSRTRGDDSPIARLAGAQHGVVARRQLLHLGWSEDELEWRIQAGRLHRVHAGVYSLAPWELISKQGWWMAAVLASGPQALLSHRTAAALWGLRGYSSGAIHVTVPRKSTSTQRIRRHFSLVLPDERGAEEGIPATSINRTIFDLAATENLDTLVAMIKEAEYLRRYERISLPALLERYPGKRGSRKIKLALQRIIEEPPGRTQSKLEQRFASFLRGHSLPSPRFNDWILLGHKRFQADCHWPQCRLIVELDGWEGHSTRSAFQDDRARDRALHLAGYTVIHLTWSQLDCEAEEIASDLRRMLSGGG
jgi:very-short-patch-repair endonuclease